MKFYQKVLFLVFSLVSVVLILLFKSVPTGKLWSKYSVLYTKVSASEQIIIDALDNASIKNYICLSNQYLPLHFAEKSPEISMYRLNSSNNAFEYGQKRNSYFFDKSNQYKLYYIPSEYKSKLGNVITVLNSNGIKAGLGESSTYPFLLPLLIIIVCVLFTLFSKNKNIFIISSIIPVIYVICNPFFQIATGSIFILISLFIVSNLWNREGLVKKLLSQKFIYISVILALFTAFSSSLKSGLFCLLQLLSEICVLITIKNVQDYFTSKRAFIPVLILKAKNIRMFGGNVKRIMFISLVSSVLIFAFSFIFSSNSFNSSNSKLFLPGVSKIQNEQLPQLEDYYRWYWNVQTFPYKSLNKAPANSNTIEFPVYSEENNQIVQKNYVFTYNQNYQNNLYDQIDSLNFNAVEKLMKSEGQTFNSSYRSTSNINTSLPGLIAMIICIFILLFIYISVIIKKGMNKNEK